MFAVIKTGGKQYKVKAGDKIQVEKLDVKEGGKIDLDEVLFIGDEKSSTIGTPLVKGATVAAKVLEHKRADKITVFKKKRRQNYRRKKGHKQHLTVIEITDVKVAA